MDKETVENPDASSQKAEELTKEEGQHDLATPERGDDPSPEATDSLVPSTLPSGATTPALPTLHFPEQVQAALAQKVEAADSSRLSAKVTGSESKSTKASSDDAVIIGIAVVDFNHLVGPQVEYSHPVELSNDEELCATLPFLALPDGSHLSDEDFCYFHLVAPSLHNSTIFGISCNRQIASDKLAVRGKEVTRSTVQKAVVVLARDPVFGPIKEKLGIVTRAFFAQGDFGDVGILIEFHATLEAGLRSARGTRQKQGSVPSLASVEESPGEEQDESRTASQNQEDEQEREAVLYMGTSIRELIYKFRFKTLMLLKLLLLQRKIMFFGYPVERLCTYQYSLISLVPDLLLHLEDSGSRTLDRQTAKRKRADSLKTSDRKSLMRFMGLPLHLFGKDSLFQPYLPLQQLDQAASSSSYLIGTTNSIFHQQKECPIDVIVDVEHGSLDFVDPALQSLVNLTPTDRKWMDEIVQVVLETWNAADPSRPSSMQFTGSDDYLRARFEEYICSLLSSIKYAEYKESHGAGQSSIVAPDASTTDAFGSEFVHSFRQTRCFDLWNRTTDNMIFDLFEHKHPCEGKTSTLEDVSLRLTSGIYDLHLDEHLAPTREILGNAFNEGSKTAWKYANKWGADLARFRRDQLAAYQQETDKSKDAPPHSPSQGIHHVSSSDTPASTNEGFLTPAQQQAAADIQKQAQAAAMQAGAQVRSAIGNFGSFLAARQKAWNTPSSSSDGQSS